MKRTIRVDPSNSPYEAVIVIDKIISLTKSDCGEITYINLIGGSIVQSNDSMNTIEARINSNT